MIANPLTSVSLMLTLAGLVGSFFNIQLSQWLRDLLALEQKVKLNKAQGNETQQKAIVECRIELEKLANAPTYIVNGLVIAFVIFVLANGLLMIHGSQADPIYPNIQVALWVFLFFFISLSGWLMYHGCRVARCVKQTLRPKP